jgi:sensor histidine kinase regulating citrate/malate metabolism
MKRKLKQIFNKLLKIKTLKTSIFIPFFLFAFVFISVSLISIYVLHKKVIQKEVSFEYENIDTMLKDKIQSEALSLGLYIDRLSVNDSLVRAFKMNDRDLFQKVSKSYFKTTDFDLKPDLLNFISNDGIVRFRSHLPNEYGQKVTQQFIYKKALSTGTSFFHIGSGVYSNVSLKVIVPVRDTTQKVVGYIVVGKDFIKY